MVNIEEIQDKIHAKLKPSGWGDKLRLFIYSSDFEKMIRIMEKDVQEGRRFIPGLKDMFRAFEDCPFDQVKVIFIGQDPYPYVGIPNGRAFCCGAKKIEQPTLRFMFDEIGRTVYPGSEYTRNPDLKRWTEQGVLLLNSALSVPVGKPGLHQILWRPFIAYALDVLCYNRPELVYLFLGKIASGWAESIPSNNYKIFVTHPASAAYIKDGVWDSKNCFNQINELLTKQLKKIIIW